MNEHIFYLTSKFERYRICFITFFTNWTEQRNVEFYEYSFFISLYVRSWTFQSTHMQQSLFAKTRFNRLVKPGISSRLDKFTDGKERKCSVIFIHAITFRNRLLSCRKLTRNYFKTSIPSRLVYFIFSWIQQNWLHSKSFY